MSLCGTLSVAVHSACGLQQPACMGITMNHNNTYINVPPVEGIMSEGESEVT